MKILHISDLHIGKETDVDRWKKAEKLVRKIKHEWGSDDDKPLVLITGDIVDYLPIAQATVSQHLKVLRQAGWIEGTVEGTATSYGLHEGNIAWFRQKVIEIF